MAAVRPERAPGPAAGFQNVDDLQKAGQAVAVYRVEHEEIALASESAVAVEQLRLVGREQRLAGRDTSRISGRHRGVRREVERSADVLEPPEAVGPQRRGRAEGGLHVVG